MTERSDHRLLVPVDVLGGQAIPTTIVEAVASLPVVVLGYHEIPDQTATGQARTTYGEQAQAELNRLRTVFEDAGCDVTTRLVFTHNRLESFRRVAVSHRCDAVLILNPAPLLEDCLVAIRGDVRVQAVARLVAAFLADTTVGVTLFRVVTDDEHRKRAKSSIETAETELVNHGVDRSRLETVVVEGRPSDAILTAAADHDLLFIGESRPSARRRIFRDRAERIAKRSVDPVVVIRGESLVPPGTTTEQKR